MLGGDVGIDNYSKSLALRLHKRKRSCAGSHADGESPMLFEKKSFVMDGHSERSEYRWKFRLTVTIARLCQQPVTAETASHAEASDMR